MLFWPSMSSRGFVLQRERSDLLTSRSASLIKCLDDMVGAPGVSRLISDEGAFAVEIGVG